MKRRVTVGFSRSRRWNPFSALIQWWYGTPYSHTFIRWETPWGFEEILEASTTSVRMMNKSVWSEKNHIIDEFEIELTSQQFGLMMTHCRTLLGTPYGWGQVVGLMAQELFQLKRNPISEGILCSELLYTFIEDVLGEPLAEGKDSASSLTIYNHMRNR